MSDLIKPDLKFLINSFHHFNKLIFSNELPTPDFRMSSARTFGGQFKWTNKYNPATKKINPTAFRIVLSNFQSRPRQVVEDIIIHEMIHFFITYKGLRDSSPHGRIFRHYMNHINSKLGRHITISMRGRQSAEKPSDALCIENNRNIPAEHSAPTVGKPEKSYICLAEMTDGKTLIARFAVTMILQIDREIRTWDKVCSHSWYYSTDSCFSILPRCRSLKLYTPDSMQLKVLAEKRTIRFQVTPEGRLRQI